MGFTTFLYRWIPPTAHYYFSRTFDFASTWDSLQINPDTIRIANITALNNTIFIIYSDSSFHGTFTSFDLGKSFILSNKNPLTNIHFINDSIVFGITNSSFPDLYKSIDRGQSWSLVKEDFLNNFLSTIQFTSEDTAYALANSNSIVKSIDGGLSWDTLDKMPDVDWIYDIEFISNNIGFALVKSSSKDFKYTTDGGKTWNRLADYVKAVNKMDVLTDKDSVYFFFSAINGGSALFNGSFALKDILAGTQDKQPRPENEYMLYPNPAKNTLVISDKNGINTLKELVLYNLQGKKVLSEQMRNPEKSLDVSTLPKGIYFVKITDNNGVWVGKFMKE